MLCVSIFRQNGNFLLFRPKFAQKLNLRSEFQNFKFGFGITTSIYHVCQFSVKMENFEFFSLSLEKLPNYMRYFGCKNVESVAESWVEVGMSQMEVDGAGWSWMEVDRVGWRWMEVDRVGWRWMELGEGGCTVQQYPFLLQFLFLNDFLMFYSIY